MAGHTGRTLSYRPAFQMEDARPVVPGEAFKNEYMRAHGLELKSN